MKLKRLDRRTPMFCLGFPVRVEFNEDRIYATATAFNIMRVLTDMYGKDISLNGGNWESNSNWRYEYRGRKNPYIYLKHERDYVLLLLKK